MPLRLETVSRPRGLERHGVRVLDVRRPSDSLVELRLERPSAYDFQAGQFAYVFLPGGEVKRAYSIASAPYEADHLAFCVKRVEGGPASNYLYGLRVGDTVEISRALGSFRFDSPPGMPAVFLATGTGIAPLRSMVRELMHAGDPRDQWLFLGSRELENLPYRRDFELLSARHRAFRYVPVLSRPPALWEGHRGWIQEAYLQRFYQRRPHHAYVCGIKRMVNDVRMTLQERGLPPEAVHLERYD